jgi:L-iditol 2-dehydrogenase
MSISPDAAAASAGPAPPAPAGTNRAAVLPRPRTIELRELPIPQPGEREVLVEVRSVGVCGSDVHYYEEGRIGDFVVHAPLVLGHEASGVVTRQGPGASRIPLGTLVAIEPGVPCRGCPQCRAGRYNLCPDVRFLATPPVDGAFTRYLAVPEDFCYPVPESLSADTAALIEPLSVGIWACRKAAIGLGDSVLVTGAGPIGLLTALTARACGAVPVVCDISPERLERAGRLGLPEIVDLRREDLSRLAPYDAFIECTGAADLPGAGLRTLKAAGRAVLVGMSAADEVRLPLSVLQSRELTVAGSFRYANTYPAAIELAASGAVPLADLIDAVFPLDRAEQALQVTRRDPTVLKAVVHPAETSR